MSSCAEQFAGTVHARCHTEGVVRWHAVPSTTVQHASSKQSSQPAGIQPRPPHLSVADHDAALVVDHHMAVVQMLWVWALLLEAAHREPEAQGSCQLAVALHEGAVQRLCYRQRLRVSEGASGLA